MVSYHLWARLLVRESILLGRLGQVVGRTVLASQVVVALEVVHRGEALDLEAEVVPRDPITTSSCLREW